MAGKRALELGRRLTGAEWRLNNVLGNVVYREGKEGVVWRAAMAMKRAAIAVGEERERNRRAKRGG